ncbi:protein maelstrom homolog [Pollicipes pollicipes]|uniref:protein maelstrom homolog n=1 Tax=Pollicipes pollicipes TaxID=41117 RepID=UPI0018856477|nr:protein maelstrom homolog [Pollicipes pollicipes]
MAKIEKEQAKMDLTRKFDDRGVPLSQIAAERDELRLKKDNMLRHVTSMVHDRSGGEPLTSVKFYNLFVSLHCYTDFGKGAEYLPCEVALCEWTIADGVLRSCSYLIEPDRIPAGYKSRCRDISEATHQVPLGHPGAETNFPGVWIRLKNFIKPSFRVYPLERLLYELFHAAGEPQLETSCGDLLKQGHFDYLTDLACPFHQGIDNSKFCMLAMARRQAFTVLDRVVGHFGVELVPGRHVPQSKNDAGVAVREKEPDLPTEYKLLSAGPSRFRGGDRETPVVPDHAGHLAQRFAKQPGQP